VDLAAEVEELGQIRSSWADKSPCQGAVRPLESLLVFSSSILTPSAPSLLEHSQIEAVSLQLAESPAGPIPRAAGLQVWWKVLGLETSLQCLRLMTWCIHSESEGWQSQAISGPNSSVGCMLVFLALSGWQSVPVSHGPRHNQGFQELVTPRAGGPKRWDASGQAGSFGARDLDLIWTPQPLLAQGQVGTGVG